MQGRIAPEEATATLDPNKTSSIVGGPLFQPQAVCGPNQKSQENQYARVAINTNANNASAVKMILLALLT